MRGACVVVIVTILVLSIPGQAPSTSPQEGRANPVLDSDFRLGPADPTLVPDDKLEPATAGTVPVGADLSALYVEPTGGRAFAADATNGRVLVVDVIGGSIAGEIPVGIEPSTIAATWDGRTIFVGHARSQSILAINTTTLQVERAIPTPCYVRSLASPQPGYLIATVHDPLGPGDFPYVIRVSDGAVIQRLNGGGNLSEFDYRDAIVTVTNGADRLYLMSTGTGNVSVQSFAVADFAAGTWSYLDASPTGVLGSGGRDLSGFSSDSPVYVARAGGPLLELSPTTLEPVRTLGTAPSSTTVVVPPGNRIAASAGDAIVQLFRTDGTSVGNLYAGGPVEILRTPWIPDRFVAIVGSGSTQDIEVGATTRIAPITPFGYSGTSSPGISADVVSLLDGPATYVAVTVDSIPAAADPWLQDRWTGHPSNPLGDGAHTLLMRAPGLPLVDPATWNVTVDTTAPRIQVPSAPFTSEVADLVLSGTVEDLTPVTLTVAGLDVTMDGRNFTATVSLTPGVNVVEIIATDVVGNRARFGLRITYTALGDWFVHTSHRFRIRPPLGWTVEGNVSLGGGIADLVATDSSSGSSLSVVSEARSLLGTPEEARAILQGIVDNMSQLPGFMVQVPMSDFDVGGLPGARIIVRLDGGTSRVQRILIVLVGADEGRFWAFTAGMPEGELDTMGAWTDASVRSFQAFGPGPPGQPGYPSIPETWILLGVASAIAGSAGTLLVLRHLRGRRPRL